MKRLPFLLAAVLVWLATTSSAWACSACFGRSDSPLAQGMNWGILSLLGVIVSVLMLLVAFFAFMAYRARACRNGKLQPLSET